MRKYVYLIFSTQYGDYKIGISKNPTKRIKQLQTGNSHPLELVEKFQTKYYIQVEKSLHGLYAPSRKVGEWFDIGLTDVAQFQEKCRHFEAFYQLREEYEVEL